MLKTTERNRRQAICASLIASTIVTADCADGDCVCATPSDSECPEVTDIAANDGSHTHAELPIEGKVIYRLDPVVTSLAPEPTIAVADLPADLAIEDVLVDAISQADAPVELADSDEDASAPRLTRSQRRAASNQNRASKRLTKVAEIIVSENGAMGAIAQDFDVQVEVPALAAPTKPVRTLSKRPLLQDEYIAFGVNGR